MQPKTVTALAGVVLAGLLAWPTAASADNNEDVGQKLDTLQKLIAQQQRELAALRAQVSGEKDLSARERELVAQIVREEMAKAEVALAKLPSWLDGLKFFGDIRIRYEGQYFGDNSSKWDRNRGRVRLRFGFEKVVIPDELKVVLRLASGAELDTKGDGNSTNQTFDDSFDEKAIGIDLAYVEYSPKWWREAVKNTELTLLLGKFKNPLTTTSLLWDSDINPEGASEILVIRPNKDTEIYLVGGQWFAEEESGAADTTLVVGQLGMKGKLGKDVSYNIATAYHHWINAHKTSTFGSNANGNSTTGGVLDFNDWETVDIYGELGFKVPVGAKKLPLKIYGHGVWNIGDPTSADASSGEGDETFGWEAGVKLGKASEKGTWEFGYAYKHIERNAVLGIFTDSDFGGTDRRGHVVKFGYALAKNVTFGVALIVTERINGTEDRVLVQTDLVIKF